MWALGLGLLLGLIESAKAAVAGRSAPNHFGIPEALATNLPWWLLWALLAPLVFRLTDAFPLQRATWRRSVLVHGAASVTLTVLHLVVSAIGVWTAVSHTFLTVPEQIRQVFARYLVSDLVTYWAIVAAYATWTATRRLQEAEGTRRSLELQTVRLEAETAALRGAMTEARLAALRMELNPHFLYNALNTVSSLVQRGERDAATTMLARLSELLRRTLDQHLDHEVPIEQELDLLEHYLAIERVRFADRLEVAIDVEPAAHGALVPTFMLQPLVENAIRHGVTAVRGPARIDIRAGVHDGQLRIEVADSGPGFRDSASAPGIGLGNTQRRLAALYGNAASLAQRTRDAGGAAVVLHLPLRVEESVVVGA